MILQVIKAEIREIFHRAAFKPHDGPEKVKLANLEELKVTLGSYRFAGQYQQRPSPAEGGIFKRGWFRFWIPAGMDLPPFQIRTSDGKTLVIPVVRVPAEFDMVIQSWDIGPEVFLTLASVEEHNT